MIQNTHRLIDPELVGVPVELAEGSATVKLTATSRMGADESGLVHGGFTFGLADYAVMLAVNDPNVVLGGAQVKFLKPVRVGEVMVATATVIEAAGKKRVVDVSVTVGAEKVMEGILTAFVLPKHILAG